MKMKTAVEILRGVSNTGAVQVLFKLSEPVNYAYDCGLEKLKKQTDYVIVSALPMACATFKPQTYIFPADENGEILDWNALAGSYRGGLSHQKALKGAGYEVVEKKFAQQRNAQENTII
jgi:hypothetical protein